MPTNVLLVRWAGGYIEEVDAPSVVAHGRHRGFLKVGALGQADAAAQWADAQLVEFGDVRDAFTIPIETRNLATMPYFAFTNADAVTVDDDTGASGLVVCEGITVEEDDEGWPKFSPQFNDIILDQDEQFNLALTALGSGGSLGGKSLAASPAPPPPDFGTKINASEVTFQAKEPPTTGPFPVKRPAYSGNLYSVAVTVSTALGSDTTFEFLVRGTDILNGLGVLPAGEKYVVLPAYVAGVIAPVWVGGGADEMNPYITAVGSLPCSGTIGLLFEPRFV